MQIKIRKIKPQNNNQKRTQQSQPKALRQKSISRQPKQKHLSLHLNVTLKHNLSDNPWDC
jgi:hypothetical protein